jgi:hypothetical protein
MIDDLGITANFECKIPVRAIISIVPALTTATF